MSKIKILENKTIETALKDQHRRAKPRVYFFTEGESVRDYLLNRHNRPQKFYRTFIPEILKQHGLAADTKAVWSQKAGCSCGCSPAFILQVEPEKFFFKNIYVTIGDPAEVVKKKIAADIKKAQDSVNIKQEEASVFAGSNI